jgi:transposase
MVAAVSIEGAVATDVFEVVVRGVLVPALRPGDLVLVDTLSVHHASCMTPAVQAVRGQVIFLPPYSPDFSPIEPCWSKVKAFLRGTATRPRHRLGAALKSALPTLRPEDIHGWFTHCGYLVPSE